MHQSKHQESIKESMASMNKFFFTYGVLVIALTMLPPAILFSQDPVEKAEPVDTSYFKTGDDAWNLVESVSRNNPVNTAFLLERGADPNAVSGIGNTALMYAVEQRNLEIVKMLVEAGADINTHGFNGMGPLFPAIFNSDFETAKFLLEHGANPNVKDDFGVTPLLYAAATNQYQAADLLLFYGADPGLRDPDGNDPLMAAVTFENIETSDVLLQNGLDPDTRDNMGNTPLIVSTQHGNYNIMDLLLDYEADVNLANKKNYTALAYAVTYGDLKATRMLIDKGAEVDHTIDKGKNIAELARINGKDSIISLIRTSGGNIPKGLDFSEFRLQYGNSFNTTDYLVQFRGQLVDSKQGYFFGTGIDYRPFLLKIQTSVNDSIFQFRERRIGWSQSIGKYFQINETASGLTFSVYTELNGFLSFPRYAGTLKDPGTQFRVIPSAGFAVHGKYLGIRAGADWYHFDSTLDQPFKFNLTAIFRIEYPEVHYDRKEINWE